VLYAMVTGSLGEPRIHAQNYNGSRQTIYLVRWGSDIKRGKDDVLSVIADAASKNCGSGSAKL